MVYVDLFIENIVTGKLISQATDTDSAGADINIEDEKETNEMKITVKGMMCEHCEAHVKKALEAIDGIDSAVASHKDNLVTITNSKDVDEAAIKAAVEDAGYEYVGVIA